MHRLKVALIRSTPSEIPWGNFGSQSSPHIRHFRLCSTTPRRLNEASFLHGCSLSQAKSAPLGLLYRHNIGTNRWAVVCSSSVTSGRNTDSRAIKRLVVAISSLISLARGDNNSERREDSLDSLSATTLRIAENTGTISPCNLGARCLAATTCKACASSPGGQEQCNFGRIGPPYGSIIPRMASLQHGFERPGDVQDTRLAVDTIPTLAWSARPDGSAEFFNQRWLAYTGLSSKQALGSGWEVATSRRPERPRGLLATRCSFWPAR